MDGLVEPKTSELLAGGVGPPPSHFRRRATTVARFAPADTLSGRAVATPRDLPGNE